MISVPGKKLAGDFGIYAITLRKLAKNRSAAPRTIGNALVCRLVCTSVAVGEAAALAWQINADRHVRTNSSRNCDVLRGPDNWGRILLRNNRQVPIERGRNASVANV